MVKIISPAVEELREQREKAWDALEYALSELASWSIVIARNAIEAGRLPSAATAAEWRKAEAEYEEASAWHSAACEREQAARAALMGRNT